MRILETIFRAIVQRGSLTLLGPNGYRTTINGPQPGAHVALRFHDRRLNWQILLRPELAFAEGWMDGRITIEDGTLADFLMQMQVNTRTIYRLPYYRLLRRPALLLERLRTLNPPWRARRNVAHHYDIGNEFYRLWLDSDMQYSCAYFETGSETLEQAQLAKKRHIAAKLALRPDLHVLDIGCGWGGMALYLAAVAGVRVTGITLSREQLDIARARARALGMDDRVKFELIDYRKLSGCFDRIVSVGMLEHVGAQHLRGYFDKVARLLTPDGVALIHAISSRDPLSDVGPFVLKYIFPGGFTPNVSQVARGVEHSGLWLTDMEILRVHYAHTLRHWRTRFEAAREQAEQMFDARFARMWELYLTGAEMGFSHGQVQVFQAQLAHDRQAVPLTRDYIAAVEQALRASEAQIDPRVMQADIGMTSPTTAPGG